jgi:type II secretory pathway pseudopilin PulG
MLFLYKVRSMLAIVWASFFCGMCFAYPKITIGDVEIKNSKNPSTKYDMTDKSNEIKGSLSKDCDNKPSCKINIERISYWLWRNTIARIGGSLYEAHVSYTCSYNDGNTLPGTINSLPFKTGIQEDQMLNIDCYIVLNGYVSKMREANEQKEKEQRLQEERERIEKAAREAQTERLIHTAFKTQMNLVFKAQQQLTSLQGKLDEAISKDDRNSITFYNNQIEKASGNYDRLLKSSEITDRLQNTVKGAINNE